MAARKLYERLAERTRGRNLGADGPGDPLGSAASGPLEGSRAETIQRLQIGVTMLAVMLTLIALASIIGTQAKLAEEAAVPDAAPTTEPTEAPAKRDPLADAGVVPEMPKGEDEQQEPGMPALPEVPRERGGEGARFRMLVPDTPPAGPTGGPAQRPQGGAAPGSAPGNAGQR